MTTLPRFCRLPLAFDAASLLEEAVGRPPDAWVSHFNVGYHNRGWNRVTLRGSSVNNTGSDSVTIGAPGPAEIPALSPWMLLALTTLILLCVLRSARLRR